MLNAEARVETVRAARYLAQVCRHFSQLRPHESRSGAETHARPEIQAHAEWSETCGTVSFGWGTCTMQADPDFLTLRAEAPNEEKLQRVQGLIGEHVQRFGKHDQLTVNWKIA